MELKHYVDVHCHIVHEKFEGEEDAVAERARAKGLEFCVVNGLEPQSNRAVLELCERHPGSLLPALGAWWVWYRVGIGFPFVFLAWRI